MSSGTPNVSNVTPSKIPLPDKKKIHHVFIDIGLGTLENNAIYTETLRRNRERFGSLYQFKIWQEEDCEALVKEYSQDIQDAWHSFPSQVYKIDFVRPLILYKEGGLYLDLDLFIKKDPAPIFLQNFVGLWKNQKTGADGNGRANNDIMHFNNRDDYLEYANFCVERTKTCRIPDKWKVGVMTDTVGWKAFDAFRRHKGWSGTMGDVNRYFYSYWTGACYRSLRGQPAPKHYKKSPPVPPLEK